MRVVKGILLLLVLGLQTRLWFGEGSFAHVAGLKRQIRAGGWEIEEVGKLFFHPFGSNVPKPKLELSRDKLTSVPRQLLYRKGIPHVGIRASAR